VIRDALHWTPLDQGRAACGLCAHRCVVAPGASGICGVRVNRDGKLRTLVYGAVIAEHVDPIEKKPLYHFLPGTTSLSIATVGCNFRCGFCQNWEISQASKEPGGGFGGQPFPPEEIVREAKERGCASISYTYTEPTIFFEYARDTALLAKAAGLANNFVTNGYLTPEALADAKEWLDAANVDLKAFRDETYRRVCGARLDPVLDTIRGMRAAGIWVEVTTLVVPDLNDSEAELGDIARFIAGVDPNIPWHISRFHPDYMFQDAPPTPAVTLDRAFRLGKDARLKHVYVGNVPGRAEDTICSKCGEVVIRRRGFSVVDNRVPEGRCPRCETPLAGRF